MTDAAKKFGKDVKEFWVSTKEYMQSLDATLGISSEYLKQAKMGPNLDPPVHSLHWRKLKELVP